MANLLKLFTPTETGQISAKYLPTGKALESKNDTGSNLFKLLKSSSLEFNNITSKINEVVNEFNVNHTISYLEDWEKTLGIPDSCFTTAVTTEQRRNQCIAKIMASGVQTADDLVAVIKILGFDVTVTSKFATQPTPATTNSNIVVVSFTGTKTNNIFPVSFPWPFKGSNQLGWIRCFIIKLIQSTDMVEFRYLT